MTDAPTIPRPTLMLWRLRSDGTPGEISCTGEIVGADPMATRFDDERLFFELTLEPAPARRGLEDAIAVGDVLDTGQESDVVLGIPPEHFVSLGFGPVPPDWPSLAYRGTWRVEAFAVQAGANQLERMQIVLSVAQSPAHVLPADLGLVLTALGCAPPPHRATSELRFELFQGEPPAIMLQRYGVEDARQICSQLNRLAFTPPLEIDATPTGQRDGGQIVKLDAPGRGQMVLVCTEGSAAIMVGWDGPTKKPKAGVAGDDLEHDAGSYRASRTVFTFDDCEAIQHEQIELEVTLGGDDRRKVGIVIHERATLALIAAAMRERLEAAARALETMQVGGPNDELLELAGDLRLSALASGPDVIPSYEDEDDPRLVMKAAPTGMPAWYEALKREGCTTIAQTFAYRDADRPTVPTHAITRGERPLTEAEQEQVINPTGGVDHVLGIDEGVAIREDVSLVKGASIVRIGPPFPALVEGASVNVHGESGAVTQVVFDGRPEHAEVTLSLAEGDLELDEAATCEGKPGHLVFRITEKGAKKCRPADD